MKHETYLLSIVMFTASASHINKGIQRPAHSKMEHVKSVLREINAILNNNIIGPEEKLNETDQYKAIALQLFNIDWTINLPPQNQTVTKKNLLDLKNELCKQYGHNDPACKKSEPIITHVSLPKTSPTIDEWFGTSQPNMQPHIPQPNAIKSIQPATPPSATPVYEPPTTTMATYNQKFPALEKLLEPAIHKKQLRDEWVKENKLKAEWFKENEERRKQQSHIIDWKKDSIKARNQWYQQSEAYQQEQQNKWNPLQWEWKKRTYEILNSLNPTAQWKAWWNNGGRPITQ